MKRYYRKNRSSVALFLVSNLLAAGSSVFMSFLLGTFADSAMEGDLSRVWKIALVTLFYLCIETFFAFLLDYSRDIIVQRVGRDLRADAVRQVLWHLRHQLPAGRGQQPDHGQRHTDSLWRPRVSHDRTGALHEL